MCRGGAFYAGGHEIPCDSTPAREATWRATAASPTGCCFNPRLPRGRRRSRRPRCDRGCKFQSAPPAREATTEADEAGRLRKFQSAPPAREATCSRPELSRDGRVSIRASRAGGDVNSNLATIDGKCFNPRLPRGRRRNSCGILWRHCGFNPRLPRGRRLRSQKIGVAGIEFQSAPPAREATSRGRAWPPPRRCFNPRLPRGRRPVYLRI